MSLSKNKLKYIQSLKDKKYRSEHQTFVAEGHKTVLDLISTMKCQLLVATNDFLEKNPSISAEEIIMVSERELEKASFLKTPQQVMAVFYQKKTQSQNIELKNRLSLALDGIQDPGNLGTIVRLADWYGIENIFCSKDTADIYNPKTVQATMGALARVSVHYVELDTFLSLQNHVPIYGTHLNGKNLYNQTLTDSGIIVMGNEGKGISPKIEKLISKQLYIPHFPENRETSESLNVAIATAIICAEFRRRNFEM